MKELEKKAWLCYYCIRQLDKIKEEPLKGFSKSEEFFIRGLNKLYEIDEKHGKKIAEKYKEVIEKKIYKIK